MKSTLALVTAAIIVLSMPVGAGETPRADGAMVYFVELRDGDSLKSPVKVVFGLSGMGVAPAGTEKENTGHHHLLVDRAPIGEGEQGAEEFDYGLAQDDNHLHFGKGQTETVLELAPGKHTLQLVMGDLGHVPHNAPLYSEVITITVE